MNLLTDKIEQARARRTYYRRYRQAAKAHAALYRTADPAARAELLDRYAYAKLTMGEVHHTAYGPYPIEDEGGRDMAESLTSSAALLALLALTERGVAIQGDDPTAHLSLTIKVGSPTAEECALWGRLVLTADRAARADLIDQIYPLAAERVGAQAAEGLGSLASTERSLACAAAGHPHPYRWLSWPPPRGAVLLVCFASGALIATPGMPALAKAVGIAIAVAVTVLTVVVTTRLGNRDLCGADVEKVEPR